jgi:hypothetical protein
MFLRLFPVFVITALVSMGCCYGYAQTADNKSLVFSRPDSGDDDRPKSLKETLEKMRIEKEKKDHNEMIERGEEVLRISEQLEKAFEANGKLTDKEIAKLAVVEKIVKKIRNELGGDDDDENSDPARSRNLSVLPAEAIKSLRDTTVALFDELKKSTRFTISAAAIQSSNAVLKLARFLRIVN